MFRRLFIPNAVVLALFLITSVLMLTFLSLKKSQVAMLYGFVAIIGFGSLSLVSLRISKEISSLLEEISMGLQRVGLGEDRQKILSDEPGALGNLVKSFNRMAIRLAEKISQLEEDRQQLRTILSGMVEGVVALDSTQRILFANETALKLLGLTNTTTEGKRLWELIRNRDLMDLVSDSLAQPDPKKKELAWSLGAAKSLTIHAARLPGVPVRGAVLVLHDTTELRRLERLRQDFVANVSHELKTPLAVIKVCAETLADGAMDDSVNRMRFLNQILDQSERLNTLIMDLLSLARIEAETEMFEKVAIPVGEMVNHSVASHQDITKSKSQILVSQPMTGDFAPEEGMAAWCDEEAFLQILDNLLDNAVRYTPDGGKIEVNWGRGKDFVIIEVRDNGVGIPEADLPRIFERFYRVDKARSKQLGGTGLGLSIVKHLAQAMNGTITATSQVGKGTSFTLQLPVYKQQQFV